MTQKAIARALSGNRGSLELIKLPSKKSPSVSRKDPKGVQVSPLVDRVRFLDDEDILAIVDADFSKEFSGKEENPNHRMDFVDNLSNFTKVLEKKANKESGLSVMLIVSTNFVSLKFFKSIFLINPTPQTSQKTCGLSALN